LASIKKRLDNFWYYYKKHTFIALAIAILFFITVSQCIKNEPYDYSVVLYMEKSIPEEIADIMSVELSHYGVDLNGDGKVTVEVINCSYGENKNVMLGQIGKLQARLAMDNSVLFITDESRFTSLDEQNLFDTVDLFADKDGKAMNLKNTPMDLAIVEGFGDYMPEKYYLSKRRISGTSLDVEESSAGGNKAATYEAESLDLLHRLPAEYYKK